MEIKTFEAIRRYFLYRHFSYYMHGGLTYMVNQISIEGGRLVFRGVFYEKIFPEYLVGHVDGSTHIEHLLKNYFNITMRVHHDYQKLKL